MTDNKKTSLKDIANDSKSRLKKMANDVYTKEFTFGDVIRNLFIIVIIFVFLGLGVFGNNNFGHDCLIKGLPGVKYDMWCF